MAAAGLISLGTGLEVVPVAAAGPLAMPVGIALASIALAVRMAGTRPPGRLLWLECLLIAAVVVAAGLTGVALLAGGPGAGLRTALTVLTRPFVAADALLAGVAGLLVSVIVAARDAGAGRPRWPWERDDEP